MRVFEGGFRRPERDRFHLATKVAKAGIGRAIDCGSRRIESTLSQASVSASSVERISRMKSLWMRVGSQLLRIVTPTAGRAAIGP